ncbi:MULTISPECIES: hypothetical protein [Streptomyces]|nr:hypothetical protein [Streptomyces canarius]
MPISMAAGQAAAVCAALAASQGRPRDVQVSAVQREPRAQGARLRRTIRRSPGRRNLGAGSGPGRMTG